VKKLGSETNAAGVTKNYYADGEGGLIIETAQDVSAIIEQNKREYAQVDERARWGEWTKIGSIPMAMIKDLNDKGICRGFQVIDQKKFRAYLNDPVNRYLRTRPGRI
jgi:hypothetical protein